MRRSILFLLFLLQASVAWAGPSVEPEPLVLRGGRIVGPDEVIESGTVLLREGRIADVGEGDMPVPDGIRVIDCRGLTIYPGFIDAHATRGLELSRVVRSGERRSRLEGDVPDPRREAAVATPVIRKGLRPSLEATTLWAPDEETRRTWWRSGFSIAHLVPEGGFLSGRTAVLDLGRRPLRRSVLRLRAAFAAALRMEGGGYPRTRMGAMAHLRQFFLDARHHRRLLAWFARHPGQGLPPPHGPELEAVFPLLKTSRSTRRPALWFDVETANDADRVLDLGEEFNLQVVLSDAREATRLKAERLRGRGVCLRLDVGPAPPNPADSKADWRADWRPPSPIPAVGPVAEPERLRQERYDRWLEKVRTPALLAERGAAICFSGRGLKGDAFLAALARVMEHGPLSEAETIRALSQTPARLLGLEKQLGTVEPGKLANLTLLTAPLGSGGTPRVRYVVCLGQLCELPEKKRPTSLRPEDLVGVWRFDRPMRGRLHFEKTESEVRLRVTYGEAEKEIESMVVEEGRVRFELPVSGEANVRFRVEAVLEADRLVGTATDRSGTEMEWTATREPEEKR